MAQQIINTGTIAGDHSGDSLRTAGLKINANFTEVYANIAQLGLPNQLGNAGKILITNGTSANWQQLNSISNAQYITYVDTSGNLNTPSGLIFTSLNPAITAPNTAALTVPTLKFQDNSTQSTAYLGVASTNQIGGVKPDGTTITISNGIISAVPGAYSLPTATTSILGGVKVDGTTIKISNGIITSYTNYSLPTATTSALGGVKVDGTTITINGSGVISSTAYILPTATTGLLGGVKVDGTTIGINNGIISVGTLTSSQITTALGYTPYSNTNPSSYINLTAFSVTTNSPSGTGSLAYSSSTGVFTFTPPAVYTLPTATTSVVGGVKVDGTSVTINNGTISVPAVATIGQNSGIATLDSSGKLTAAQIPSSLTGAVIFKGTWNASNNTPTLANGTGTAGWEYAVSVGGTALGYTFNAGDYVIYNGTTWQQIPGGAAPSANALTGTTLSANVINSSLTSVGTLTNLTVTNTINGSVSGNAGTVTSIASNVLTSNQVTTALGYTPLQYGNLSILTISPAGGGALGYNSSTGVFTFTPAVQYSLPTASTTVLGGVKVDGTTITVANGVISAVQTILPTASTNSLGGVKIDGTTITINGSGVISSTSSYTLPIATTSVLGGVKGDGNTVTINASGIISANYTNYVLPTATTSILGGVKVDGTTITINGSGVISNLSTYTLPTATTSVLGGVKVDGTTITINGSGVISGANTYTLPIATASVLGGVKQGSNVTIDSGGVISVAAPYSLPTASTSVLGGVKVDGTTVTINGSGVVSATQYTLPTATSTVLGGVKVDGNTIQIVGGIISTTSTAVGLQSRTTVATTTASLANAASATATVTAAKGYALYSIQVDRGAWVTVYTSSSAQSSDSGRSITTDPTPGSGVICEAITTTATTTYFTPAVYGYNADGTVSSNMYLKIYNNSGSTGTVTVTITYLKLEV